MFGRYNGHAATQTIAKAYTINVTKEHVFVDGAPVTPLTTQSLSAAFGAPRVVPPREADKSGNYILLWDAAGVRAYAQDLSDGRVKEMGLLFFDDQDENPKYDKAVYQPRAVFSGVYLVDGKPALQALPKNVLQKAYIFLETKFGNWQLNYRMTEAVQTLAEADRENAAHIIKRAADPFSWVYIVHSPPRVSAGKYQQQRIDGEPLLFKSFNFKLAVVQALMYDKELLTPKFDVNDFAEDYAKREIDVDGEGYEPILEVKRYFRDLQIDKRLAPEVTELYLDGGNEIYLQICPQWDCEDGIFGIKAIDEAELAQFPNLKKITNAMAILSKKTRELLAKQGIELEDA
jgi:hypothetical protein